ncbi:SWI/SNF-related matrix-associated actin-dependent regulator of chromatin subfamily A-like protein 1 [Sergentomyia squamirostris]
MACSPEQIAAKRQQALERLKQNKANAQQVNPSVSGKNENGGISINSGQFYGSPQTSKGTSAPRTLPQKFDNKIKPNPLKDNRIFSQPYTNKNQVKPPETVNVAKKTATSYKTVIKCALVSEQKFGITMSKFNEEVTKACKLIGSKTFNNEKKTWSFHLNDYETFLQLMQELGDMITVEGLPRFILKIFPPQRASLDMSFLSSIEPKLVDSLLDFQKQGVRYAIERQGRCIIADEMGLGKTYQALAIADFYKDDWPVLVCTTASMRDSWAEKIRQLLPSVPAHKVTLLNSIQSIPPGVLFILSSYAAVEKNESKIAEAQCKVIILDESHMVKNRKTKSTSSVLNLVKTARRVILLTGTPALSRPCELFTQLQMCDKSFFTYKEYTKRYCAGYEGTFGWNADGQSNLEELNLLLMRKFMIRRTKDEVMSEMGEKSREVIVLDRELVNRKDSFSMLANNYSQTSNGKKKEEILLSFYSETATAKAKAVCAYVRKMLKEEKKKFIVFAYHHVMMEALAKLLQDLDEKFIKIDGRTPTDVRSSMVEMFQTQPSYRVAVLSLKACNAGITLTAAQLVIFAELYWNPSTLAQGESRSHRIGQDENVVVRYLLAEGTADDIIWSIIQKKQTILNDAGLGNEDFSDVTQHIETSASTPKITSYFEKASCSSSVPQPPVSTDDDVKKLLEDDDDLFAELDF